ncbi:MAG: hypothetical protein CFE37_04430 [Alphaproteobacteria bacterium PA4]|nr:MAG: hypothetical protein CFE37_04430 [Alphaproteobacteria bacterium PA4]
MNNFKTSRVYDIFVSSTTKDLEKHRLSVTEKITKLGHRPIAMDAFSSGHFTEEYIESLIESCDIFLIILGQAIGTAKSNRKSWTQWEYEIAKLYNKPIISFVLDADSMRGLEPKRALVKFRQEIIDSGKIVGFFNIANILSLRDQAADSIRETVNILTINSSGGWIRNEELEKYVKKETVPFDMVSNPSLSKLMLRFFDLSEVADNMESDIEEKEAIGNFIWRIICPNLEHDPGIKRIFIDGGSTTFRVCQQFNNYIKNVPSYFHNHTNEKVTISTNSILNFLELSMGMEGALPPYRNLHLYPPPPIGKTGKTFGALVNITPETVFFYEQNGWNLSESARNRISKTTEEYTDWLRRDGQIGLSIMSVAGFMIDNYVQGPWVKNHLSMLLAHCVLRSKQPCLMVIDGRKWNLHPQTQQGFRIFIDGLSWNSIVNEQPFAFAISTLINDKRAQIVSFFKEEFKFEVLTDESKTNDGRKIYRIFAFNKLFSPFIYGVKR